MVAPQLTPLPPWLSCDERDRDRLALAVPCLITTDVFGVSQGLVANLSESGCRIELAEAQSVGRYLTLEIAELPPIEGWIAWQTGASHGVSFARPLLAELIARLKDGKHQSSQDYSN